MERVINTLVEYDRKGREMVAQAERERDELLSHLEEEKQEMERRCRERAENRIQFIREQAEAEGRETLLRLKKQRDTQLEKLDKYFEENREAWVDKMVQRCLDTGR